MIGVILAIFSAIFIALAQVSLRKSYKDLKPSIAFTFDAIFGLLIWVPLALIMGVNFGLSLWEAVVFATISAILSEALFFYALSKGEIAITATVLATYSAYTVLFSWILNGETLSKALLCFVIITIAGSAYATLPERIKKSDIRLRKEIVWPFIAAVGIGLSDTISKGYINRSGDFSLLFMLGFVQIPVALAYLKLEGESIKRAVTGTINRIRDYKYSLLGGFFNIVGTGFLWLSFSYAPASIASPITSANGALTVMLSYFLLKSRVSWKKYIAIIITFVGVVGIAILQAQ
jgi:drug/metabolite transporter (DMT)-like permease